MTDTLALLVIIIAVGLLAATPGLISLRQRGESGNNNGDLLALMRQLSECLQQRDGYSSQIADLQRSLTALQERVATQEAEITSLRNVIVSMSATAERTRRGGAQPQTAERERQIRLKELETLNIQIALAEAQRTASGGDVHLETQIDRLHERKREVEALLDG